jgi:hypothetical protein
VIRHLKWLEDKSKYELTPKARYVLEKGWVYIMARDSQLRPVICFNCHLIDTKTVPTEDIIRAINRLFLIAEEYMFYPGYIENWISVVDTGDMALMSYPFGV